MNASFVEKSVWVQLAGTVLGLGAYFVVAGMMLASGVRAIPAFAVLFIAAVVFMVVLLIVGHAAAAISSRRAGDLASGDTGGGDERDRLIGWRAESGSGWVLAAGVWCAVTALALGVDAVWVVHGLIASMFASEVLGQVLRIVYYRRGMGGMVGVGGVGGVV